MLGSISLKKIPAAFPKKLKGDLGVYLAGELKEEYEARIKELRQAQVEARASGEEKRVAVTEYSGLIGASLDLAAKVFPGYEPLKKQSLNRRCYPNLYANCGKWERALFLPALII